MRRKLSSSYSICLGGLPVALLLLGMFPAQAEFRKAPNSRIALDLPDGYVSSKQFAGFVNETTGASIVVFDFPAGGYAELSNVMRPGSPALAQRGLTDIISATIQRNDELFYLRARQMTPVGQTMKFILGLRGVDHGGMITLTILEQAVTEGHVKVAEIEELLRSARIDKEAAADVVAFGFGYLGPFKDAGGVPVSGARVYSLDGRMGSHNKGRPVLIVATSADRLPVGDPLAISLSVEREHSLKDLALKERKRVIIADMEGLQTLVQAIEPDGRPTAIYQVLLAGKAGGYYRMIGMMGLDDQAQFLPEYRRIMPTFRLNP